MVKLNRTYSDYTDETDEKYPLGKAVNSSGSDSYDGTPILADLINDINASHIAMYKKAYGETKGITGSPDTQKDSQFANAIAKYTDDAVSEHSGKTGVDAHGASVDASPNQIVCRDEDGRAKVASPVDDLDIVNKSFFNTNYEKLQKILDSTFKTYLINLCFRPKTVIMTEDANFNPNTEWGVGVWEKLPDGVFVRNAGGDAGAVGQIQSESLPNITASFSLWNTLQGNNFVENMKGAIYKINDEGGSGNTLQHSGTQQKKRNYGISASKSNTIYKDNAHVTPVNIAVYYWRRVS